jgi:hypothetical protein
MMKFPNLTIDIDNKIITMRPLNVYKVFTPQIIQYTYEKRDILKIIVLYELKYKNIKTSQEIISKIPYYLSDGTTNNFRANMLYPFICINDVDNQDSGCMRKKDSVYGFMYKYQAIINLDFRKFTEGVNQKLKEKFKNCNDADNFIKYVIPPTINTGVSSVLSRLRNILDFFIALSSEQFSFEQKDEQKEYIKQYIPYMVKSDLHYNDRLYDFKYFTDKGYNEDINFIDLYNEYRIILLSFFKDYYTYFIKNSQILKVEYKTYDLESKTLAEFNNLDDIKICHDSNIIESRKLNTYNYIFISQTLEKMIYDIKSIHNIKFLDDFFLFFIPSDKQKIEQLYDNIKGWGATCNKDQIPSESEQKKRKIYGGNYYNKYIKYKLKYLNLKE